jgi:RNase H-fold protein (predicted Holliday junction resolvase)
MGNRQSAEIIEKFVENLSTISDKQVIRVDRRFTSKMANTNHD